MLTPSERRQAIERFTALRLAAPERVLSVSDEIQQWTRSRPELAALCRFGRSMQVRRLRSVAPRNWNNSDLMNAEAIADELERLLSMPDDPPVILARAVLGCGLDEAISYMRGSDTSALPTTRPERQSGNNTGRKSK